jgi:hypothetical protein
MVPGGTRIETMATFRYFATQDGIIVELSGVYHSGQGSKANQFTGRAPNGQRMVCDRKIERKNNPSMHQCDGRCLNATGFLCECSCRGKNHGAGRMVCVAA